MGDAAVEDADEAVGEGAEVWRKPSASVRLDAFEASSG